MQHISNIKTPSAKITKVFEQARQESRGVLIPYFMCGYPSALQSIKLALAAAQMGADIIELGMPFSDPLADGATIQHAGHIALEHGMTVNGCFEIAFEISTRSDVPLILMGYYNPILVYGLETFCQRAVTSGVCGLIIPDLPPEEAEPLQHADCVALNGVTGARATLPADLQAFIHRVKDYMKEYHLPIAVGFGISTPEHISELITFAEGVVVGSAVIKLIDKHVEEEQIEAVKRYILSLNKACLDKKNIETS